MRQHSAALLIVRAKETERGQTWPTGGLFYGPSNRQVGMGGERRREWAGLVIRSVNVVRLCEGREGGKKVVYTLIVNTT